MQAEEQRQRWIHSGGCYCALVSGTQDQGPHSYEGCTTDFNCKESLSVYNIILDDLGKKKSSQFFCRAEADVLGSEGIK